MNKTIGIALKQNRLPQWLKKEIPHGDGLFRVKKTIIEQRLNTVCHSAQCPNKGECFSKGTATFMIMGDTCTRDCRFCAVRSGIPSPLKVDEPDRIGKAVRSLKLSYVVVTSVARDDLPDGGAKHFSKTIQAVRTYSPISKVEVLVPDFQGCSDAIREVVQSRPTVFNHNLETISRFYSQIRPDADYQLSLKVLESAKKLASHIITKSGLMLGLGETLGEVKSAMKDLRAAGCNILTLGQYIKPSDRHVPVDRFLHPDEFKELEYMGKDMGFCEVASGPFVRSSYRARQLAGKILEHGDEVNERQ